MTLHQYDKSRNFLLQPGERGRIAFWCGRALYANPLIGALAQEWRAGWIAAEDDFHTRGGQARSEDELARLRPKDVPVRPVPHITNSQAAAGKKAAEQRRRGKGWSAA